MHALTNSGAVLLAVLLFFLLILLAELSYIFCRRTGSLPSPPSKEVLLQFLMCYKKKKNHSSIEPRNRVVSVQMEADVVAAVVPEEDLAAADKWRMSRLLFTIEEEDLEFEDDDDDVVSTEENGELRVEIPVEYSGEPTPFLTPCDSPPYFTPSPSPGREVDDVIDVYDVISSRSCCFNFQGSQMC